MSISLRLTADLTFVLALRTLGARRGGSPIVYLDPGVAFGEGGSSEVVEGQSAAEESDPAFKLPPRSSSPIVWIGGFEPLEHAGIARVTNALASSGRHIFLETSGIPLKHRLHEFQPTPRFYFTVRFEDSSAVPDEHSSGAAEFHVGLEAIRMARLAGFLTCANLVVRTQADIREWEKFHAELCHHDVDGCLITAPSSAPDLAGQVAEMRKRLLSRGWALLSSLLESSAPLSISHSSVSIARLVRSDPQADSVSQGAEAG
jgi:hypothetical protein